MKLEVGQLWRWRGGLGAWNTACSGKCFLIIERFTHVNSFSKKYRAARYVMDGEIDWDHVEDILTYAEVINEAG